MGGGRGQSGGVVGLLTLLACEFDGRRAGWLSVCWGMMGAVQGVV